MGFEEPGPIAFPRPWMGALGGFPEKGLEFGKGVLDRVEIGAVGRQVEQESAGGLDQGLARFGPLWLR